MAQVEATSPCQSGAASSQQAVHTLRPSVNLTANPLRINGSMAVPIMNSVRRASEPTDAAPPAQRPHLNMLVQNTVSTAHDQEVPLGLKPRRRRSRRLIPLTQPRPPASALESTQPQSLSLSLNLLFLVYVSLNYSFS